MRDGVEEGARNQTMTAFAGHLLANYADYPTRIGVQVHERQQRFLQAFAPPEELRVIRDIGKAIEVDPALVHGVCSGLPEGE